MMAFAAACSPAQRAVTLEDLRADLDASAVITQDGQREFVARVADRIQARGDSKMDVLVLSGGGQHGAFGAGFLAGWRARTDPPMPEFDVVTGISTGALLAPFAFIGTAEAIDTVAAIYRNPRTIMPRKDAMGAAFRGTGALFNVSALKSRVEEVVDAGLVARMQPGFSAGRRLLVGTTDLDLGQGRVWNLADEADTTAAGVARMRALLLASAAIPGAFPPVLIDGHYHVDGGITTNLLAADLAFYRDLERELSARGVTGRVTVRLWAIVNMTLGVGPEVVPAGDALKIGGRSLLVMLKLDQQHTLTRYWEICEAVNAGGGNVALEMHYTAIPDAWNDEPGASELFDETYMRRLQEFGRSLAMSDHPWAPLPPGPF